MKIDADVSQGVGERDLEIVRTIGDEELSVFSFDGLRRISGSHPETLSRILERLEEQGFVMKSPDGYMTTGKVKSVSDRGRVYGSSNEVPLLHTFLPYGTAPEDVMVALAGKWFDSLRWVGMAEGEDGVVMKWVTDDGSVIIDLKMSSGQVDIDARMKNEGDFPKGVRGAHQLIGRIGRLHSMPRAARASTPVKIGYFRPYAM